MRWALCGLGLWVLSSSLTQLSSLSFFFGLSLPFPLVSLDVASCRSFAILSGPVVVLILFLFIFLIIGLGKGKG